MNVISLNNINSGKKPNNNPLWDYPIWTAKTPFDDKFNEDLMDELYSVAKEISVSPNPKISLWDYPRPNLQILKDYFDLCIEKAADDVPELRDLRLKFKSIMGWPNVRAPGLGIDNHAHPDTSFAITYYVKTPKDCGDLICYMHDGEKMRIKPEAGNIVIIPFYVLHEIELNQTDDLRISISADYFQIVDESADNALVLKSWCNDMMKVREWNSAS
jgi:hypothetical protein